MMQVNQENKAAEQNQGKHASASLKGQFCLWSSRHLVAILTKGNT